MTKSRGILGPRVAWTAAQDAVLLARYADTPTAALAATIGCSVGSVYRRAYQLGLAKSAAYFASPAAGRTNGRQGIGTRFKKGQVPQNKGLRRPGWSMGRMRETQFPKGSLPHNTVPVGTETVRRDGYTWVKVRADAVPARRGWVSKHQAVYEAAHGPIPEGHIVRFKDGNITHFALDNLECVSRAEHARTKALHSLPPELVKVHQLRGAIIRQINKRQPPVPKKRGRPPKSTTTAREATQ